MHMTRLTSSIDPASEAFQTQAQQNRGLVDQLRAHLAQAALGGPSASRERHESRGKLLPRDRVMRLLDPGAPFLEIGALAAHGLYDDEAPGAGLIAGVGKVAGREVMILANDATVKGGAYFPMTVKKHLGPRRSPCRTICLAFILWIPAAPTCRTRPRCFPIATISAASSSIRPR